MKKTRLLSLLLALMTGLALLSGCTPKAPPLEIEAEVALAVVKDLVPRSYEMNMLFFGRGLPLSEAPTKDENQTEYIAVTDDCGYASIKEIKTAAEKVYSKRYLNGVYVAAFVGVTSVGEDGGLDASVSPRYREIGGKLTMDAHTTVNTNMRGRLTVEAVTVESSTAEYVTTTVLCKTEDGQSVTMTVLLAYENGVWLLDSPTY